MSAKCEVQLCPRDAAFDGLCVLHRKKAIAGELDFDDDTGLLWDLCSKGHRWTIENTHYENNAKGGKRRRCRLCLIDKARRKAESNPGAKAPDPIRPKDTRMTVAMDQFDKAQAEIKGTCHGEWDKWTDYTADTMPTAQQARLMCEGCPLFAACANNADATNPSWGVWAGERWVYGRRYDAGQRNLLHPDD